MEPDSTHATAYYTKAIIIFILMATFLAFEMALQVSPGVMTTQLIQALKLSAFGLGILSGFYFVTYTLMQIPSGLLYDRANFRLLVTTAILICSLGVALFGSSEGIVTGSVSRLLMGFGSAFAFLSVLTVAARYFPARYFALLTGLAQMLAAIGGMAGELPIAAMVDHFGWRHSLWILAIFGLMLALVIWFFIRKPKQAPQAELQSEPVWHSLTAICQKRQTWMAGLYAFFNWAPITAFASLWGVPFIRTAYQMSTTEAAGLCALIWLGIGVASPIIGGISDWIGRRNPLMALMALLGLVSMAIVIYVPHLPVMILGLLLFVSGMGSGGQILSFAVVKDGSSRKRVSTTIGFNNMAVVASGFLVQPLIGKLISWGSGHGAAPGQVTYTLADFHRSLSLIPIFYGICLFLALFGIQETYCKASD